MRVLLVHPESRYFGGAETVLGHLLSALPEVGCEPTLACVPGSRVEELVAPGASRLALPANSPSTPSGLLRQLGVLRAFLRDNPGHVVHAWAARDWEVSALAGALGRRPVVATLHDHPRAFFLSRPRQLLMRGATRGARRLVCVSEAVRQACLEAGYASCRLTVIRNGLPPGPRPEPTRPDVFRLGFLGVFTERKGFRDLFEIADTLPALTSRPWELLVAGEAQDPEGAALVDGVRARFSGKPWWPRVRWCGWVSSPELLSSLDLLLCPSSSFDPLPTVLLEAGRAAVPALASRVGGVPEVVDDGVTGWLFDPGDVARAARLAAAAIEAPAAAAVVGQRARLRVESDFSAEAMARAYWRVYEEAGAR